MKRLFFQDANKMSREWFEVWCDPTLPVPYVLMVLKYPHGSHVVVDPRENNKVLYENHDYEEVRFWLQEDEYTRTCGREYT